MAKSKSPVGRRGFLKSTAGAAAGAAALVSGTPAHGQSQSQGKATPPAVFIKHQLLTRDNVDHVYPNDELIGLSQGILTA